MEQAGVAPLGFPDVGRLFVVRGHPSLVVGVDEALFTLREGPHSGGRLSNELEDCGDKSGGVVLEGEVGAT